MILPTVLVMVAAYVLGAIPFGYILVRLSKGKDVRSVGSGSTGATNVLRAGGKWVGILTLLLDIGKGALAVGLARWVLGPEAYAAFPAAATLAVVGHVFPVFLGFKGGKGAATGFGAYLALTPYAALITISVFILTILLTRYVSLGSILGTGTFPLWTWLLGYGDPHMVIVLGTIPGVALIVGMHYENIGRLLRGEERKLGQKKVRSEETGDRSER